MRFEEEETDLHVVGHHAGVHGSSAGSKGSAEFVSEGVKAKQKMSKLYKILYKQHIVQCKCMFSFQLNKLSHILKLVS